MSHWRIQENGFAASYLCLFPSLLPPRFKVLLQETFSGSVRLYISLERPHATFTLAAPRMDPPLQIDDYVRLFDFLSSKMLSLLQEVLEKRNATETGSSFEFAFSGRATVRDDFETSFLGDVLSDTYSWFIFIDTPASKKNIEGIKKDKKTIAFYSRIYFLKVLYTPLTGQHGNTRWTS